MMNEHEVDWQSRLINLGLDDRWTYRQTIVVKLLYRLKIENSQDCAVKSDIMTLTILLPSV